MSQLGAHFLPIRTAVDGVGADCWGECETDKNAYPAFGDSSSGLITVSAMVDAKEDDVGEKGEKERRREWNLREDQKADQEWFGRTLRREEATMDWLTDGVEGDRRAEPLQRYA
jgi:hypothetical protein